MPSVSFVVQTDDGHAWARISVVFEGSGCESRAMHEMAIAQGVVRILEEQAVAQRFTAVKVVWLELGALSLVPLCNSGLASAKPH